MYKLSRSIVTIIVIAICIVSISFQRIQPALTMPNLATKSLIADNIDRKIDFGRHFQELGINGSIVIDDLNHDRVYQYNSQRNNTAFLPASTFKILNSLISLETGVIPNELALLTWDGIPRALPEWNRDLNMREAIKISAVWFYQVLARRVGHERMQQWIDRVEYGNHQIGTKENIDKFWLEGDLRITPNEQIKFLNRLYKNDLPFSPKSIATVKDIMIVEQTSDYILRGKTGLVSFQTQKNIPQVGWFVGYLEQNKNVYFFATNIDIRDKKDVKARIDLTNRCLKDLALL
jgi:beta-lactamase class D